MRKLTLLWPFLWLLLVWGYVVIPFSSASEMDLGESNQIFTVLLILHAGLYALNCFQIFPRRRWWWLYVVLQAGLVVGMSLVLSPANTFIVSIGLYLALIGEAISLQREYEGVTLTVVSAVVSFLIGITVRGGWEAFHHAILYVAPVMLMAVGYIALSFRLARANEQSQTLFRELEEAHATLAHYADRVKDLTLAHERERLAKDSAQEPADTCSKMSHVRSSFRRFTRQHAANCLSNRRAWPVSSPRLPLLRQVNLRHLSLRLWVPSQNENGAYWQRQLVESETKRLPGD